MTVYNINLGIGWASSGVEYAQAYRAKSFSKLNIPAKFIFSDLILANNIEDLTANLGFADEQIIWLYNFFTDVKIAPSNYQLKQLEHDLKLANRKHEKAVADNEVQYILNEEGLRIVARFHDKKKQTIDQVSYVSNGVMVKRDFYSYVKYACEYYSGTKDNNHVTFREFYNEDGSIAYTEHLQANQHEIFEFPDQQIFYSKNDLYRAMIKRLDFQADDVIILDRMSEDDKLDNGQIIFEQHQPAKLIVVVHADHYDVHHTNSRNILWNNFYEYSFTHTKDVASYIVATDKQRELFAKQEKQYYHQTPQINTVPVGSLTQLRYSTEPAHPHSLITASRLASEKHLDWLVKAVIAARQQVADVTLDIYGQGAEQTRLQKLITDNHAESYIQLKGQHDLTDVYTKYAAYIAASTSEGFGLSLLEAVGSGLPMIGFDVPYGNQTFIDDEQNGYLMPYDNDWSDQKKIKLLTDAIVKMFTVADLKDFGHHSHKLAEPYLVENVAKKWQKVLEEVSHD